MEVNNLPTFPDGRDMEVTDWSFVCPALKLNPVDVADYNFTNMFAWRKAYNYKISEFDGMILHEASFEHQRNLFPPLGDPKKVAAFEVWLFDKNDIQTVTKVLMSAHAFEDDAIRQRLEAKGEPLLVEPGSQAVLDTATLRLVARIVDMSYGEGALPDNSFFEGLILELAVWQK